LLGNNSGVETYTVDVSGTGTETRLTVDSAGNPVTKPTRTTTTFGAVGNSAVTDEITAIATALGLTAPTSTTSVNVTTPANGGTVVYSVQLSSSSGTTGRHHRGAVITVDANGNPVGDQRLPFGVIPSAIQAALNANKPSGATALDATSTQNVSVRSQNGVTTYSVVFTATGTETTVTVNAAGALASLPSKSTTDFQSISAAAQAELQKIATADGMSATIATTQSVSVYDEANGTTVYSVTLSATTSRGTRNVTISVDQNGNPTTLPNGGEFGGIFPPGDFGGGGGPDGGGSGGHHHHGGF
jgi:hypothetical protein